MVTKYISTEKCLFSFPELSVFVLCFGYEKKKKKDQVPYIKVQDNLLFTTKSCAAVFLGFFLGGGLITITSYRVWNITYSEDLVLWEINLLGHIWNHPRVLGEEADYIKKKTFLKKKNP